MESTEFDEASISLLEQHGFRKYKKNKYIRIKNDLVFYLSFGGRKKDIYIWYSIVPLCMPKIWLNVGHGNCTGRFPKNENELSINAESDRLSTSLKLKDLVKNNVLPLVAKAKSMKDVANLYISGYPSGIAHLALGDFNKGMSLLKEHKEFIESLGKYSIVEGEVENFIDNATKDNVASMLENERQYNIKKLRLRKYIKKL